MYCFNKQKAISTDAVIRAIGEKTFAKLKARGVITILRRAPMELVAVESIPRRYREALSTVETL